MQFDPKKLDELHKMLNAINVTDDYISRGVRMSASGTTKIANKFGIQTGDVPAMIDALSKMVREDLTEDASSDDRFSFEADYMGNLTLRDQQSGEDVYLQGDEAFALSNKLTSHPDKEQLLIAPYFKASLNESVEDTAMEKSGTFNFPYKGKFATASYGLDSSNKFALKVISLRDGQDNDVEITPDMQTKLDAIALTWVDKV